jgi:small subunit ribosomal protein S8
MSMTDPIADMLTWIRNGIMSRKARIDVPALRFKQHIAEILKDEGFITDYRQVVGPREHPLLQIDLKWTPGNRNAIIGLRRVSRPGRRTYVGKAEIPKVRGGQGVAILTTSIGVMLDRSARK